MEIFNNYTTDDVLWNDPYIDDKLKLYPLKVKEYKNFQQYLQYFIFSKKHYQVDNKVNLFDCVLTANVDQLKKQFKEEQYAEIQLIGLILQNIAKAFSVICREQVECDLEQLQQGVVSLKNKDGSIEISKKNFDKARRIILKSNVISEPKIFEDEIEKTLADKWIKAKQMRNSSSINGLGEMANLISCATGKSYDELFNQNILQLYCDFYRCTNTENHKATTLFRTVSDTNIVDYQQEIISQVYADPYDGLWRDANAFIGGLGN